MRVISVIRVTGHDDLRVSCMGLVPKTTEIVHRPKVQSRGAGSIALRSAGCALAKKTSDLTIHLDMTPTLVPGPT